MCSYELKLLDNIIIQKQVLCNKALSYTSDNRYCVVVEDGLFILQLYGYTDNFLPIMSFNRIFIPLSPNNLKVDYNINMDSSILTLSRFEYYEAILCLDLDEDLKTNSKRIQQYIQTEWSPRGLTGNNQALACLTNTSTLNVYACTVNEANLKEYIVIVNIAKLCFEYLQPTWVYIPLNITSKIEELKRRMSEMTLTCFTWTDLIIHENTRFCFLIVGHLSGMVSFWKFNVRESNNLNVDDVKCVASHKTGLTGISALYWQQGADKDLLFVGDTKGRVKSVLTKLTNEDNLIFENELTLWKEMDDISVDMFKIYIFQDMIYLLVVKNNFLLTYMFDSSGKLLDTHGVDFGNCRISWVEKVNKSTIFVLMYTGVIKEIKLSCVNNKINLQSRPIYLDFNWSDYDAYGLAISPSKAFIGVLVNRSKIGIVKQNYNYASFLIFVNYKEDPVNVLMKNASGSLENYWDCIEIERVRSLKEKYLSCLKLPSKLNYDKLTLTQLKTCYWLFKISKIVSKKLPTITDDKLLPFDTVKKVINIKVIVNHMHHLLELFIKESRLAEFHMHSLYVANMYLKQIILDDVIPQLGLGDNSIKELFSVIQASRELVYPSIPVCNVCEKEINGLTCTPRHLDTRCHISLMQIVDLPYYKCSYCSCTVHIRLRDIYDIVLCPYCDIPLDLVSYNIHSTTVSEECDVCVEENSALEPSIKVETRSWW